jgi:hypothetical protein
VPNRRAGRIFVSYRREDASGHVLALLQPLHERFGVERIFSDNDGIEPGQDFIDVLERELASCSVMLVVIGREWLTIRDERRQSRRLDDPRDFVRMEVATALQNEDMLVIPVLVERASMPPPEELPPDLQPLSRRNALELSDSRWKADVDRLIEILEKALGSEERDATPGTSPGRGRWLLSSRRLQVAAVGLILAGALGLGRLLVGSDPLPAVQPPTGAAIDRLAPTPSEGTSGDRTAAIAVPETRTPPRRPAIETRDKPKPPVTPVTDVSGKPDPKAVETAPEPVVASDSRPPDVKQKQEPSGPSDRPSEPGTHVPPDSTRPADRQAIEDVLERFRSAYTRKDARGIRDVYPDVEADSMLKRVRNCSNVSLTFGPRKFEFLSSREVQVVVDSVYGCRTNAGKLDRQSPAVRDTFRLERRDGSWVIVGQLVPLM